MSGFTYEKIQRDVILHFSGGLRGSRWPLSSLKIGPVDTQEQGFQLDNIPENEFLSPLQQLGLVWIGTEEIALIKGLPHSFWYSFGYGNCEKYKIDEVSQVWSAIAYAGHQQRNTLLSEQARSIGFSLIASSLRLRDISNEYHRQLRFALVGEVKENCRFGNTEQFDLFLALHSFFAEMCSARDFLARFIALFIHKAGDFSQMSKYYKYLAKQDSTDDLGKRILSICDKKNADGWMARLGQLRDNIIHSAPLHQQNQSEMIMLQYQETPYKVTLPQIIYEIKIDPFDESPTAVLKDALRHCHLLLAQMEEFAAFVSTFSPVRPQIRTITDKDIISAKKLVVENIK